MKGEFPRAFICIVLLTGTLWVSALVDSRSPRELQRPLYSIGMELGGWRGTDDAALDKAVVDDLQATSYIMRTYRRNWDALGVFIAYYSRQRAGESMHPPRHCLPGNGWSIVQSGFSEVPGRGQSDVVNRYYMQNGDSRRLVLYWYQSRRRIVASEYAAKAFLIWDGLRDADSSGTLVRVTLPESPAALATGLQFAAALILEIQNCLGR